MTGPDLDPQLSAAMRRTLIAYARKSAVRRLSPRRIITALGSIALVAGVAAAAVVISVAGLPNPDTTPPAADTPTPSATASPTPSAEPTPAPPPTPTASTPPTDTPPIESEGPFVNGFDAPEVYQACIDATPEITGFGHTLVAGDFMEDSVRVGVDPYTQDSVPESEWPSVATVYVDWPTGSTPVAQIVGLCTVSGSSADPIVTFNRTLS